MHRLDFDRLAASTKKKIIGLTAVHLKSIQLLSFGPCSMYPIILMAQKLVSHVAGFIPKSSDGESSASPFTCHNSGEIPHRTEPNILNDLIVVWNIWNMNIPQMLPWSIPSLTSYPHKIFGFIPHVPHPTMPDTKEFPRLCYQQSWRCCTSAAEFLTVPPLKLRPLGVLIFTFLGDRNHVRKMTTHRPEEPWWAKNSSPTLALRRNLIEAPKKMHVPEENNP